MKKLFLIGSFVMAITGVAMTSCEPSHKGTGTPGSTDTLSTMQNQNSGMDTTVHADTSHQKK